MPLHLTAFNRLRVVKIMSAGVALLVVLLAAGCGKPAAPANDAPARRSGASTASDTAASTATNAVTARSPQFLAVFSTNETRDPFNPKAKPRTPENVAATAATREADEKKVIAALQRGFQGIYGAPGAFEMILHGVLLADKRESVVSFVVDGQPRRLKVKPVQIHRNAAELQVEGLAKTVTVPQGR